MNPRITAALVLAVGISVYGHRSALAVLAADDADNYPYSPYAEDGEGVFVAGQDGGFGFDPWVSLGTGIGPSDGANYVVEPGILGLVSWGISGFNAMGRGLETPLSSGTWKVEAQFNPDEPSDTSFAGFNLKSVKSGNGDGFSVGELLRFGLGWNENENENSIGLCLSLDSGVTYTFLDCNWAADAAGHMLKYSVSWDAGGGYILKVDDLDGNATFTVSGTIAGWSPMADPVAMLGVAIYGAYNDEELVFDAFTVVPEPRTTASLLALAAVGIFWHRRRRAGHHFARCSGSHSSRM